MAFGCQYTIGPVLKNNRNQLNNIRDTGYAFILGAFVYNSIGLFGSWAIINKKEDSNGHKKSKEWAIR